MGSSTTLSQKSFPWRATSALTNSTTFLLQGGPSRGQRMGLSQDPPLDLSLNRPLDPPLDSPLDPPLSPVFASTPTSTSGSIDGTSRAPAPERAPGFRPAVTKNKKNPGDLRNQEKRDPLTCSTSAGPSTCDLHPPSAPAASAPVCANITRSGPFPTRFASRCVTGRGERTWTRLEADAGAGVTVSQGSRLLADTGWGGVEPILKEVA